MAVYATIFLGVIGVSATMSWADRGAENLRGAIIAVDYARGDLREKDGRLVLREDGRFIELAGRNPALWLVVVRHDRTYTFGAVGPHVLEMVKNLSSATDSVVFRLPGQQLPIGAGKLRHVELDFGPAIVAAGGVDPATLSTRESIHLLMEPEIALMLAIIAVISLLAMLVAVPAFVRALRPIAAEAAAITPDDPGRRLREEKAPKELLPIVHGFNAALDRLEAELGRRKRFIADVAHELRTPLAVVSLQAESLPEGDDKAHLQRGLGRLTNLVVQMLDLERLSLFGQQRSQVDLVSLTRDVIADLAPLAVDRGYDLSLAAPELPVIVSGDPHAITRAVTNLIMNSIAHAGGGPIEVIVAAGRTIDVRDKGPGIAADLQPILFEPFARGDSSAEGCGLGLHLSREVMKMHGGQICLLAGVGNTTFRLSFPSPNDQAQDQAS